MSSKLTFVFLLWRLEGATTEQFADYYENTHLGFVTTLVPSPPFHERSYPVDGYAILPANQPREGVFSFDSLTAVTFDTRADYDHRMSIFASDESKRKAGEEDGDRFTQSKLRVSYVASAEISEASEYKQVASSAVNVLQIMRRQAGKERANFKTAYEEELAKAGSLPGELRHVRYYLLPQDPLSFSGEVWGDQPQNELDVVQDFAFSSHEAANQGIERLRAAAQNSSVIEEAATVMFYARRLSGVPTAWAKR